MSFTIHLTRDYDQMSAVAAEIAEASLARTQAERGDCVLGLATGNSPTGLYKYLAKAFNAGRLDPRSTRTFNLDEYAGLPAVNAQQRALHPESYSFFMVSEFFGLVSPHLADTNVPWGTLIDQSSLQEALASGEGFELVGADKGRVVSIAPDAEGYLGWIRDEVLNAYEARIVESGGIDLHVIGVGGRGHVAFHESGIPFEGSTVMLVQLDDNTVENAVADGHFPTVEDTPRFAISMGAELVFRAREVLMVANGSRKTEPVTEAVLGEVTTDVPLSYAQTYVANGGKLSFVLDEEAAAGLIDRLDDVTAKGIEVVDHRGESYPLVADLTFARDAASGSLV
ncbi:MAG: 6-phosphogluconolactonase [Propionibacteriaceae bacterium]|nr:6-phosphogluconolactonase [Propionibacteriaceae bacterium]